MDNKSTILSLIAIAGVAGTAVATAKCVPKAEERIREAEQEKGGFLTKKETIAAAAPAYIPPALIGVGTAACILGANALNKKQQASLISSYAVLEQCYKRYRETLIEMHGQAADEEVLSAMAVRKPNQHVINLDRPDQKLKFHEPITNQFFEAYEREVMDAEYHFNRNYVLGGEQSVNNLCYFLNIQDYGELGDNMVWIMDDYLWIDFDHELIHSPTEGDYYEIVTMIPPEILEED